MKLSVMGCGRWGTFLSWYAGEILAAEEVLLYGREGSARFGALRDNRANEYGPLSPRVELTSDLERALGADIVLVSVGAQSLRDLAGGLAVIPATERAKFVLCMKGIEESTGKRLTQVFREEVPRCGGLAIWVGPGHVQDFYRRKHNAMVLCAEDMTDTKALVDALGSDLIRFYYGQDMVGNEIGAASKNVVGIIAGMLDGLGETGLKGALMARGTREIARLVRKMGGNELTIYGLSHLGDYEATLFSPYSNNRSYGENYILGRENRKLAEGVKTTGAMVRLGALYDEELPICNALHKILYGGLQPRDVLDNLFLRDVKFEF